MYIIMACAYILVNTDQYQITTCKYYLARKQISIDVYY